MRMNRITRYRLVEEHLVGEGDEPVQDHDLLSNETSEAENKFV